MTQAAIQGVLPGIEEFDSAAMRLSVVRHLRQVLSPQPDCSEFRCPACGGWLEGYLHTPHAPRLMIVVCEDPTCGWFMQFDPNEEEAA